MRDADAHGLRNRWMTDQLALDLGWADIEAAADDDVLQAVYHPQVAVLIEGAQVAGFSPALRIPVPAVEVRRIEVGQWLYGTACPDLTYFTRSQLVTIPANDFERAHHCGWSPH